MHLPLHGGRERHLPLLRWSMPGQENQPERPTCRRHLGYALPQSSMPELAPTFGACRCFHSSPRLLAQKELAPTTATIQQSCSPDQHSAAGLAAKSLNPSIRRSKPMPCILHRGLWYLCPASACGLGCWQAPGLIPRAYVLYGTKALPIVSAAPPRGVGSL